MPRATALAMRWEPDTLQGMALTPSSMLPLGTTAPEFSLPATDGQRFSLKDFRDAKALIVVFMCNHCPYVKHVREQLAQLGRDSADMGVAMVGINANDPVAYPDDNLEAMKREVAAHGYTFPYLLDETQAVAKAYRAACTPDFYLFDGDQELVYRGQLDPSRPGNGVPVDGRDLRAALQGTLTGEPINQDQQPSLGCNIKWRAGNEPAWFG